VVGAGVLYDVGVGLGMFLVVRAVGDRRLTLVIVTDGGLHVRFESGTRHAPLSVLQLLHCLQRRADGAGWLWPSSFATSCGILPISSTIQTP